MLGILKAHDSEQNTFRHVPYVALQRENNFNVNLRATRNSIPPQMEHKNGTDNLTTNTLVKFSCAFQSGSLSRLGGHFAMAIHRLIAAGTFGPDEIKAMTAACEAALTDLGFADREDPLTELIAKSIVNVTATGERDPETIKERALNALGVRRPAAITQGAGEPTERKAG